MITGYEELPDESGGLHQRRKCATAGNDKLRTDP